jgi:hypothetical protein
MASSGLAEHRAFKREAQVDERRQRPTVVEKDLAAITARIHPRRAFLAVTFHLVWSSSSTTVL